MAVTGHSVTHAPLDHARNRATHFARAALVFIDARLGVQCHVLHNVMCDSVTDRVCPFIAQADRRLRRLRAP